MDGCTHHITWDWVARTGLCSSVWIWNWLDLEQFWIGTVSRLRLSISSVGKQQWFGGYQDGVCARGVAGGGKLSILPRDRTQFKISISVQQCRKGMKEKEVGNRENEKTKMRSMTTM